MSLKTGGRSWEVQSKRIKKGATIWYIIIVYYNQVTPMCQRPECPCGSCKAAGGRLGIPPPFLAFLAVAAALAFVAPEAAHEEARFGITWHEARVWALSKRELLHIMAKPILGSSKMNHKFFFCE